MIVGITGHQDLGNNDTINWVKFCLSKQIDYYKPNEGLSCLAVGADQLFVEVLIDRNIPFNAIIPSYHYLETFKNIEEKTFFLKLLDQAKEVTQLPFAKPSEDAFFEASKNLVNRSNILFAIWDNLKAKGKGGTADVVSFAASKGKKIIHINPINKQVFNIN